MSMHIPAQVEEPACVARRRYPVTNGCPFPQGQLFDEQHVRLINDRSEELPLQSRILASWPDGSIKWLLLDTQMDLRPREVVPLSIEYGKDIERTALETPLQIKAVDSGLRIETGALTAELNNTGPVLIAAMNGQSLQSAPQMTVQDADGTMYTGQVETLDLEESNALRAVLRAEGRFVSDDGTPGLNWIVRFYIYAHQPFMKIYHTFEHRMDEPVIFQMREMVFRISAPSSETPHIMTGSPKWVIAQGDDWGPVTDPVTMWETGISQYTLLGTPEGRIDRRTVSHGWIYRGEAEQGVMLKLRHPAQNYPKLYTADQTGAAVHLYPNADAWTPAQEAGRKYSELNLTPDGEYAGALSVPQGMAKTHEMFLYAGPPAKDLIEAAEWAATWEFPLLLRIDSAAYADSGALGMFPRHYPEYWRMEETLRANVVNGMSGDPLTGMMNIGDTGTTTMENGMQKTLTTDNVSYDHTRAVLRQYLRRGDQSLLWQSETMAMHLMDIDTVRHSTTDPERVGGPRQQWSQFHHYTDTDRKELAVPRTSHVWLGGLLDLYYITGYRRALETVMITGRYCAGTRDRVGWDNMPADFNDRWEDPRLDMSVEGFPDWYSPRRAGWALTGMTDWYEATADPRAAEEMRAMVQFLSRWQDDEGRWRSRFGAFMYGTQVFMVASILNGLMRTFELLGDETARELCIRGCRFLATETVTPDGLMYYKESPMNDTAPLSSNVLTFRPMVFAYEQTGDPVILRAMWRQFLWMMDNGGPRGYEVKDALWALPTFKAAGLLERWEDGDVI